MRNAFNDLKPWPNDKVRVEFNRLMLRLFSSADQAECERLEAQINAIEKAHGR